MNVRCLNPWDVQSKHVVATDGKSESLCAGEKRWGSLPPNVLYEVEMDNVKCLNPLDSQSKRQYRTDGAYASLQAMSGGGGRCDGIVYSVEGHVVDRNTANNGKGWCENVSPTLNTQDRHAVVYAIEGNGTRPSHFWDGYSDSGRSYTLNATEQHAVCYSLDALSSNSFKSSNPHSGIHETQIAKCLDTRCLEPSCNQGGMMICCAVDCRNGELNEEISCTLQAHNNGGWSVNCTNPVMYEKDVLHD